MKTREVKKVVRGIKTEDGAGVKLTRVLGNATVEDFDPFLMLDAFDSRNPDDYVQGFPWHPHRGIETLTYLIHGNIEHGDSIGNKGCILDGSCQWMTAGSGIIHQEMPKPCPHMLGVQLWLNLPKEHKMAKPAYHSIEPDMIPKIRERGACVSVIASEYKGHAAKMRGEYVPATYLDVSLGKRAHWKIEVPKKDTLFIYTVEGEIFVDGKEYDRKRALLFDEGDTLELSAGPDGARFLLLSAPPLHEPVAWGGPIVMNTDAELKTAFKELEEGTFIKGDAKYA